MPDFQLSTTKRLQPLEVIHAWVSMATNLATQTGMPYTQVLFARGEILYLNTNQMEWKIA